MTSQSWPSLVEQGLEQMIRRALERMGYIDDAEAKECRRKLALIHAKECLKASEATYRLGCSDVAAWERAFAGLANAPAVRTVEVPLLPPEYSPDGLTYELSVDELREAEAVRAKGCGELRGCTRRGVRGAARLRGLDE